MKGHSPPGYLSAVKITQVLASDSLLALLHQASGGCWLSLLSFSQELCLVGTSKVSHAGTAQQWPTFQALNHPISPWCQNSCTSHSRSRSLPELCATTLKSFSLPTPKAPMGLLPSGLFIQGRWLCKPRATHIPHKAIWRGTNIILLLRFVLCECLRAGIALYLLLCTCKTQSVCRPGTLALIRKRGRECEERGRMGLWCGSTREALTLSLQGNLCWILADGMEGATWCLP